MRGSDSQPNPIITTHTIPVMEALRADPFFVAISTNKPRERPMRNSAEKIESFRYAFPGAACYQNGFASNRYTSIG